MMVHNLTGLQMNKHISEIIVYWSVREFCRISTIQNSKIVDVTLYSHNYNDLIKQITSYSRQYMPG